MLCWRRCRHQIEVSLPFMTSQRDGFQKGMSRHTIEKCLDLLEDDSSSFCINAAILKNWLTKPILLSFFFFFNPSQVVFLKHQILGISQRTWPLCLQLILWDARFAECVGQTTVLGQVPLSLCKRLKEVCRSGLQLLTEHSFRGPLTSFGLSVLEEKGPDWANTAHAGPAVSVGCCSL